MLDPDKWPRWALVAAISVLAAAVVWSGGKMLAMYDEAQKAQALKIEAALASIQVQQTEMQTKLVQIQLDLANLRGGLSREQIVLMIQAEIGKMKQRGI